MAEAVLSALELTDLVDKHVKGLTADPLATLFASLEQAVCGSATEGYVTRLNERFLCSLMPS